MSLDIENDETRRLAGELARLTGETLTDAIAAALRERLEREKRLRGVAARADELVAIGRRCAPGSGTVRRRAWRHALRRAGLPG